MEQTQNLSFQIVAICVGDNEKLKEYSLPFLPSREGSLCLRGEPGIISDLPEEVHREPSRAPPGAAPRPHPLPRNKSPSCKFRPIPKFVAR